MNTKNEKTVINDKDLERANGGVMPIICAAESEMPAIEPLVIKPESEETKGTKNDFVPIPY